MNRKEVDFREAKRGTPTAEDIIQQKIEFLNGSSDEDIDLEMQAAVEQNEKLREELKFVDSIWANQVLDENQMPSSDLQARFYQMLSRAQSHQQETKTTEQVVKRRSIWESLNSFLRLQPIAQFGLLLMLFFGGWFSNHWLTQRNNGLTAGLEQQVASLNTLVALSMLQNQSASERLAGVSYTKDSRLDNQKLTQTLLKLLNNDNSSAVRLAVIDALSEKSNLQMLQVQLLASLEQQDNAIVQIALTQLLLNRSESLDSQQIERLLNNQALDADVIEYLRSYQNQQSSNSLRT